MQTNYQKAEIYYNAPRAINIGDVFYRVESGESVCFREPCKVCDGTGKLTVKGVTFKCPCCDTQKEVIVIHKYVVRRYRVCKIEQKTTDIEWKPCDSRATKFLLYRKTGRGYQYDATSHIEFTEYNFSCNYNRPFDGTIRPHADYGIYDDYKVATKIAEQMNAVELQRLADYNKEFGTEHEAVFKVNNDPKSN